MYLDGESQVLSIENRVSITTCMIKLENRVINQVSNYLIEDT